MPTPLSSLVDNLSEINKKECKKCMRKIILNQNVSLSNLKIID